MSWGAEETDTVSELMSTLVEGIRFLLGDDDLSNEFNNHSTGLLTWNKNTKSLFFSVYPTWVRISDDPFAVDYFTPMPVMVGSFIRWTKLRDFHLVDFQICHESIDISLLTDHGTPIYVQISQEPREHRPTDLEDYELLLSLNFWAHPALTGDTPITAVESLVTRSVELQRPDSRTRPPEQRRILLNSDETAVADLGNSP